MDIEQGFESGSVTSVATVTLDKEDIFVLLEAIDNVCDAPVLNYEGEEKAREIFVKLRPFLTGSEYKFYLDEEEPGEGWEEDVYEDQDDDQELYDEGGL